MADLNAARAAVNVKEDELSAALADMRAAKTELRALDARSHGLESPDEVVAVRGERAAVEARFVAMRNAATRLAAEAADLNIVVLEAACDVAGANYDAATSAWQAAQAEAKAAHIHEREAKQTWNTAEIRRTAASSALAKFDRKQFIANALGGQD